MENKKLISIKEFAELYGLKEHKAREMVKIKDFPAFQLGATYQIYLADVDNWIRKSYSKSYSTERAARYVAERRKRQ